MKTAVTPPPELPPKASPIENSPAAPATSTATEAVHPIASSDVTGTARYLGETVTSMPLDRLIPHPMNVKIYGNTVDEAFVEAVRVNGIYDPVLITKTPDGSGCHLIISGHRRHEAAKRAGHTDVPVVYFESPDENDILTALLEGNRQRVKGNEQRAREYCLYREIEQKKAALRQKTSVAGQEKKKVDQADKGKARDLAAKFVGQSGVTADRGLAVVQAIDSFIEKKKPKKVEQLREAFKKSVDSAYRLVAKKKAASQKVEKKVASAINTVDVEPQRADAFAAARAGLEAALRALKPEDIFLEDGPRDELAAMVKEIADVLRNRIIAKAIPA